MRTLNMKLITLLIAMAMTMTACGGGSGGGDDDDGGSSGGGSDNGSDTGGGDNTPEVNYTTNGLDGINGPEDRSNSGDGASLTLFSFGVDLDHQEFENLTVAGMFGATDDDGTEYMPSEDDSGVGTFYAGLVAGQNVGVAPAVTLNNIRVFRAPDDRELGNSREALTFTEANFTTDVLLLTYDVSESIDNAEFDIELRDAVTSNDWVIALSGGNVPDTVQTRGTYNYAHNADDPEFGGQMIVVGATDGDGNLLENSAAAYAPSSYTDDLGGHFIVAPGQAVCSSGVVGGSSQSATVCNSLTEDGDETIESSYYNGYGTGPATALVGGAAATIRGLYPTLDAATVVDVLLCSADDLGDPGYDELYGAGLLNVQAAITLGQAIVDGGDFGDCDVPEETQDVTPQASNRTATSEPVATASAPMAFQQATAPGYSAAAAPAGTGISDCTAYIRDESGMLYFRDRRGNFSLSEDGCMAPLY
ncbi:S8/S53 family peptidase [Endozoicomonas sp. G2_2]|uniref:S8/S53 family peptidase n=1 Tax=Endozoicomonas sp. G2_2 TaxID=2821092 RepID=UPI001AD9E16E|nr:S8/S53 family peptidase [Endozoicomonas sp. G2_2]MBO9471809.1 S8/S53 family peptidase [Endozoicomonas sp. G2_2]